MEHTEQAIEIVSWHLQEAGRLFALSPKNIIHQDAKKLIKWMSIKGLTYNTAIYSAQAHYDNITDGTMRLKYPSNIIGFR